MTYSKLDKDYEIYFILSGLSDAAVILLVQLRSNVFLNCVSVDGENEDSLR